MVGEHPGTADGADFADWGVNGPATEKEKENDREKELRVREPSRLLRIAYLFCGGVDPAVGTYGRVPNCADAAEHECRSVCAKIHRRITASLWHRPGNAGTCDLGLGDQGRLRRGGVRFVGLRGGGSGRRCVRGDPEGGEFVLSICVALEAGGAGSLVTRERGEFVLLVCGAVSVVGGGGLVGAGEFVLSICWAPEAGGAREFVLSICAVAGAWVATSVVGEFVLSVWDVASEVGGVRSAGAAEFVLSISGSRLVGC